MAFSEQNLKKVISERRPYIHLPMTLQKKLVLHYCLNTLVVQSIPISLRENASNIKFQAHFRTKDFGVDTETLGVVLCILVLFFSQASSIQPPSDIPSTNKQASQFQSNVEVTNFDSLRYSAFFFFCIHSFLLSEQYIEEKLREKHMKEKAQKTDTHNDPPSSQPKEEEKYQAPQEEESQVVGNWQAGLTEYELPIEYVAFP